MLNKYLLSLSAMCLVLGAGNALGQGGNSYFKDAGKGAPPNQADMFDPNMQRFIHQTIDTGKASGELKGALAKMIQKGLNNPSAKVFGEFTTIKNFSDPACKRIQIKMTSPGNFVTSKTGQRVPFVSYFGMNICKDGSPPQESINEALSRRPIPGSTAAPQSKLPR